MHPRLFSSELPTKEVNTSHNKAKGLLYGIFSPISFGFIPLFTVPLIEAHMNTPSILAYRFLIAAAMLLLIMWWRKVPLKVSSTELLTLLVLGLFYIWSAMGLQVGYRYMPTGIATLLHFTYPVWVILFLLFIYKQRPAPITIFAILLASLGVATQAGLLSSSEAVSWIGIVIVASTGIAYAFYMIIVGKTGIGKQNPLKVSFYVLLFTGGGFLLIATFMGGIQPIPGIKEGVNMLMLSLVSTVIANIYLVAAIKLSGATINSILGALEPLSAVVIGVLLLDEKLTIASVVGIGLILISVIIIALSGRIAYVLKIYRLRRRHLSRTKR